MTENAEKKFLVEIQETFQKQKVLISVVLLVLAIQLIAAYDRIVYEIISAIALAPDCPCLLSDETCMRNTAKTNIRCCKYLIDDDVCRYEVALETKNSTLCYLVREPFRRQCFQSLAALTGNQKLCAYVEGEKEYCEIGVIATLGRISLCENFSSPTLRDYCIFATKDFWGRGER